MNNYYLPFDGARFIDKAGNSHVFIGGKLSTADAGVIAEIEDAIKSGAEIFKSPIQVVKSDSLILKDVGPKSAQAAQVAAKSGTGMQTSLTAQALAKDSMNAK